MKSDAGASLAPQFPIGRPLPALDLRLAGGGYRLGMHNQPIAAVTAVALMALASSAGANPAGCVPAASTPLRASGAARIYSQGSALFGCLGPRRTRLGSLRGTLPFPARRVVLYALSPRYAATDTVDMGVDTLASTVALIDLESGKTTATAPATTPERAAESFVSVTAIRVNATGTLAWIGKRSAIGALEPIYEVHALLAGKDRLLASTRAIRPSALQLHANALSWLTGGHKHSTTL
jgi:hypothetical protein